MMLGCFTAILLLLGLMIEKDIPQSEDTQAGTPATLSLVNDAKPRPTGLDDGGN